MHLTINKLYALITRLVVMMEDELNEISHSKSKNSINVKKNLTDSLSKLVSLIIQLNKVSMEHFASSDVIMPEEDQKIIDQFLAKYRTSNE